MKLNLILLHGALGAKDQMEPLKNRLSDYFEVYSFNFYGHGGEPGINNKFDIVSFARQLENFIEAHNLSEVNIFGYSMGGYVALYLAHLRPGLISSIFTYATKFDWTPETSAREVKLLNAEKILEKVPAFAKQLNERHQPNDWALVLEQTGNMMLELGKEPLLSEKVLKSIDVSVIISVGGADQMVSIEESRNISELLCNARLLILENFIHPIEKLDLEILVKEIKGNQLFKI